VIDGWKPSLASTFGILELIDYNPCAVRVVEIDLLLRNQCLLLRGGQAITKLTQSSTAGSLRRCLKRVLPDPVSSMITMKNWRYEPT
jgi:hypothetical protein